MEINNLANKSIPIKNQKYVDTTKYIPEPYKKVAKGMEAQFAQFMLEQMQKTIHKSTPESSAEKYYRSLLTQERADKLVSKGGLGIQEMILNQIYPQRLRNKITYEAYQQQHAQNNQRPIIKMSSPKNDIKMKESL